MSQTRPLLIQGGHIIDPAQDVDRTGDLLIEDGVLAAIDPDVTSGPPDGAQVIDASGLVVCPGFIDVHCHLREPGFEYKETIASGTRAAAAGGFQYGLRHAQHRPGHGLAVRRRVRPSAGPR